MLGCAGTFLPALFAAAVSPTAPARCGCTGNLGASTCGSSCAILISPRFSFNWSGDSGGSTTDGCASTGMVSLAFIFDTSAVGSTTVCWSSGVTCVARLQLRYVGRGFDDLRRKLRHLELRQLARRRRDGLARNVRPRHDVGQRHVVVQLDVGRRHDGLVVVVGIRRDRQDFLLGQLGLAFARLRFAARSGVDRRQIFAQRIVIDRSVFIRRLQWHRPVKPRRGREEVDENDQKT